MNFEFNNVVWENNSLQSTIDLSNLSESQTRDFFEMAGIDQNTTLGEIYSNRSKVEIIVDTTFDPVCSVNFLPLSASLKSGNISITATVDNDPQYLDIALHDAETGKRLFYNGMHPSNDKINTALLTMVRAGYGCQAILTSLLLAKIIGKSTQNPVKLFL